MTGRLEGKIAMITGAAQGIGAKTAEVFAAQGANLLLLDNQREPMEKVAQSLTDQFGTQALSSVVDITDVDTVKKAVEQGIQFFQRIDILINCAGINVFSDPLSLTKQDWDRCLSVDLDGLWHCCRAVLPGMLDQHYGHIVNIASVHGHKIIPGAFPYPVAKHAVIGLTRSLGIEYAAVGIRVNSISPGLIDTPIAQAYFDACSDPDEERRRQETLLPCKRLGQAREVANTALFLASDEALFINATDILIDGGRSQLYCDSSN
jgi:NAD(P)-dependent dehydrogenase (short-subunit alcohol dehydrogenase family)